MSSHQTATTLFTAAGPIPDHAEAQLSLPQFETSAEEIRKAGKECIEFSKKEVQRIGNLSDDEISFSNVLGALDDLDFYEGSVFSRIYLLQNVHPDSKIRDAAREVQLEFRSWNIEKVYDEKIYQSILKLSKKDEAANLKSEDKKILKESLRDFRRLGMDLPAETKNELQKLKKELSKLETSFSQNIQDYQDFIEVKQAELQGLEREFIDGLEKTKSGKRKVSLDYPEYLPVMEHCQNEDVRRKLLTKKYKTAADTNSKTLNQMVILRKKIANLLGYKSWNHYTIEDRMAKSPEKVIHFLDELAATLQPKGEKEIQELTALKKEHTKNPRAKLEIWDYYFYSSLLKKTKYGVNSQEIKNYFPLHQVLRGMFDVFEKIFDIEIKEETDASHYKWHEDVQLFCVRNTDSSPVGYFYLDLHPREGKYGHAAAFGLISGKYLPDGYYQRPVSAMVCNFAKPTKDRPSLISHNEVETLFHEFGHILHNLLTKAKFTAFSGTSVAWDFVEAPSQVLENWTWDVEVLQSFAKHYQDPRNILSKEIIDKMLQAKKAGVALFYLRQISLAKADLSLHGEAEVTDSIEATNQVLGKIFMPPPPGTSFAAGWGHLVGYASGYYGYAWADVMAADLFSKFKENGIFDKKTGAMLRKEIYEPGSSRDESESLKAFLGRELSNRAFLEDMGV